MFIKKLFALLLVVLMLAAALPEGVLAETPDEEDVSQKEVPVTTTLDPPGEAEGPAAPAFDAPKGEAPEAAVPATDEKGIVHANLVVKRGANDDSTNFNYDFSNMAGYEADGYNYAQSTTKNTSNSTAYLTTEEFHMYSGEWLSFWYWFETEEQYDKFYFYYTKDGSNNYVLNGMSGHSGGGSTSAWVKYTFYCSNTGTYQFTWKYNKDGSNNSGADCIRISRVTYSRLYEGYMFRAGVKETGDSGAVKSMLFNSGNYAPTVNKSTSAGHERYLATGNGGQASSTCVISADFYIPDCSGTDSGSVSFNYAYSTEANHDWFRIYLDGTLMDSFSGSDNYSWKSKSYLVTGAGIHTIRFTYTKDSSIDSGSDVACVDNIAVYYDALGSERSAWFFDTLNASGTNSNLTFNTPKGYTAFVPASNYNASDVWVAANNRYYDGTDSAISTVVNMNANEKLSFQYFVNSEKDYDRLEFWANDQYVVGFSGWDASTWTTYTYTAPSKNCYTFKWVFHKDSTDSNGYDQALIDNVRYYGSFNNNFSFEDALNASDSSHDFVYWTYDGYPGTDLFQPCYATNNIHYAQSRNTFFENTEAVLGTDPVWLNPGDFVSFSYKVNAASDEKLVFSVSGPVSVTDQTFYGQTDPGWTRYTFHCTYAGSYSFLWKFVKNSISNGGLDCAMISDVAVELNDPPSLDEILNENYGGSLHFTTGSGNNAFVPYCSGTDWVARAASSDGNNIGATEAYIQTEIFMKAGDKLKFYYKAYPNPVSGASFKFSVNGTNRLSVTDGDNAWHSYTYTAFTAGRHLFKWTYQRPNYSYDVWPGDYVQIDDVQYDTSGRYTVMNLYSALNVDGGTIIFNDVSGTTPFICDWWEDDDIATSGNVMQNSTDSALQATVYMNAGDSLVFQYYVSSETNYDKLTFKANGTTVFTKSGELGWDWYEWTATSTGSVTFEWRYHKDSSNSFGYDCVKLDNVEHVRSGPLGMLGDVDNNGVIDTIDALLALRAALGIVSLDSGETYRADVTGDGTVNTEDALLALRHALGIINLSPAERQRADVDGNGVIDTTDALLILRYALGIINAF